MLKSMVCPNAIYDLGGGESKFLLGKISTLGKFLARFVGQKIRPAETEKFNAHTSFFENMAFVCIVFIEYVLYVYGELIVTVKWLKNV